MTNEKDFKVFFEKKLKKINYINIIMTEFKRKIMSKKRILYIDESGNTGSIIGKKDKFNFKNQPYYVLSGILVESNKKVKFKQFIEQKIEKYKIYYDKEGKYKKKELKSTSIYRNNYNFVEEIIDYIYSNKIPIFIELMDKKYFICIDLVNYFFLPYYSLPNTDENREIKRLLAGDLTSFLSDNVYHKFLNTVKKYTNTSLENFYDFLISNLTDSNKIELAVHVKETKNDYFYCKQQYNKSVALKRFLPLFDKKEKGKVKNLLPNYSAFTNLLGRVNKLHSNFNIIHDEQEDFEFIFQNTLENLKKTEIDELNKGTIIEKKVKFKIKENITLDFINSKDEILIQIADLVAGIIMRFWRDHINLEYKDKYLSLIKKINSDINFVVPNKKYKKLQILLSLTF